jgi:hypothetical protein
MVKRRVYALALGYEDLSDHGELHHDLALQTATSRVETLASPATLCRLEQRSDRGVAVAMNTGRIRKPPTEKKLMQTATVIDDAGSRSWDAPTFSPVTYPRFANSNSAFSISAV